MRRAPVMVLAFIVLGILAPSSKGQDSQYSILLRNVYSHWAPPPNAPIVRGELSVNAAGVLTGYRFVNLGNDPTSAVTGQSLLAAINQTNLTMYAADAASSLDGIVRVGFEFDPKEAQSRHTSSTNISADAQRQNALQPRALSQSASARPVTAGGNQQPSSAAGSPASPSFNCSKASLPVDFVICSDPQVLQANQDHETAWFAARARLDDAQKKVLLTDQRQWLQQFPPTCGVAARGKRPDVISPAMQQCTAKALLARAEFLQHYSPPQAVAQASTASADGPPTNFNPQSQSAVAAPPSTPPSQAPLPVQMAQTPSVTKQCGDRWGAAKAADTAGNLTWPKFLSQCRTELGAQPASAATAPAPAAVSAEMPKALQDAMAANGRQDYVTGARLLRPLAEQGNAEAQAILGNMYRVGRGVPQDFAEAIKWYRKAVAQGNSMAQRSFGDMYEHGWGVAKDDAEAAKWHRMAADQGDVGLAGGMRSPPPQDDVDFTQAKHVRTVPIFGGGTLAEPANMMPIASDAQLAANQGGGTQANPKPQLNLADVSQLLSKDAPQQRASTGRELSPVASPIPAHASEAQLAELDQLIDAAYRSCWNYGGGQSSAYIPEILLDFQATGALASGPILQNPPPFDADRPLAVAAMRIASNCVVHVPQKFWPFAAEYEKRVLRFDPRVMGAAFEFR